MANYQKDDFNVVSGLNVLLKHKVIYMPLAKCLVVMESNPMIIQKNIPSTKRVENDVDTTVEKES